jgi:hypothetical protein
MSWGRTFLLAAAAAWLTAASTDASAQYRSSDRQTFDRQRKQYVVRPQKPAAVTARKLPTPVAKPADTAVEQTRVKPSIASPAAPAPATPLTEEQIAAKSAIDELLARDPALSAAKQVPDPALAKAAAAKHNAEERRLAALKAKEEAEAAKRRDREEKNKAREEARTAALKAKYDAAGKNAKPKIEQVKAKPGTAAAATSSAAPGAAVQPPMRMPAPEGPPMARNL